MVRLGLPTRLKSSNDKNGECSQPGSRGMSPMRTPSADSKGLVLKTKVIRVGQLQHAG